jgi:gluconolactonase
MLKEKVRNIFCVLFILFMLIILFMNFTQNSQRVIGKIERSDPEINLIVPEGAFLEVIADGFDWSEGPVWVPSEKFLLFSDIPKNTIYKWSETEGTSVYLRPAGYAGPKPLGRELGTNGLLLDSNGNLIMCDHGNRCIERLNNNNFTKTVLVDNYEGKKLNSPNDAVYKSNGDLYFTDPPYGLEERNDSPHKELDFNGVYLLSKQGELTLLTKEVPFPNGIALSPDEKTLYVGSSNRRAPIWKAFDVKADGTIENGRIFYDATKLLEEGRRGVPDGMTVDQTGNVYGTGPGGVLIFNADGKLLGTIETGQATANCSFGEDGSTLFITADMFLCRIRLKTKGIGY